MNIIFQNKITRVASAGLILLTLVTSSGCVVYNQPLGDPSYIPPVPEAIPPPQAQEMAASGSIYHATTSRFLFENFRARRVGDIVTVLLEEKTAASKSASTDTSKSSNVSMSLPKVLGQGVTVNGKGIFDAEAKGSTSFTGKGGSNQSNSLNGSVTVHVVQVLPNGNLRVRGEKLLSLNQGSEVIRITGIIRPQDISNKNTIASYQVADTKIAYKGKGMIADSNKAGWLSRFFNSNLWPY